MVKNLVKGVVYSKFDEKMGPVPWRWEAPRIPHRVLEILSTDALNLSYGNLSRPKELAMVPLPDAGLKAWVKYMRYTDCQKRGGMCETTLSVIFDEGDDVVFYKYKEDFEEIINEYGNKIVSIEEAKNDVDAIQSLMQDFFNEINDLGNNLRNAELSSSGSEKEFPNSKVTEKFKLVICGNPNVGKTSLVLRYTKQAFRKTYLPTLGVNLSSKTIKVDNGLVTVVCWDLAGQLKFQAFREQFYKGSSGRIIVFDLTDRKSFDDVKDWYKDLQKVDDGVPYLIIGNKNDLKTERVISKGEIQELKKELGCDVVETSALTGSNTDNAFKELIELMARSN
ncbi:MAG: Rab family GTPase [Promethearchaeota archaeon]